MKITADMLGTKVRVFDQSADGWSVGFPPLFSLRGTDQAEDVAKMLVVEMAMEFLHGDHDPEDVCGVNGAKFTIQQARDHLVSLFDAGAQ